MTLMRGGDGDLLIQATLHATNRWVIIPVDVAEDYALDMVLDTGSPLSAISRQSYNELASAGRLIPFDEPRRRYILQGLSIQGQPIIDLQVRVSLRVTQAGADGVLRLDFLQQFREVCFDVPSLRLTLRR
jgi:hypothetical protein